MNIEGGVTSQECRQLEESIKKLRSMNKAEIKELAAMEKLERSNRSAKLRTGPRKDSQWKVLQNMSLESMKKSYFPLYDVKNDQLPTISDEVLSGVLNGSNATSDSFGTSERMMHSVASTSSERTHLDSVGKKHPQMGQINTSGRFTSSPDESSVKREATQESSRENTSGSLSISQTPTKQVPEDGMGTKSSVFSEKAYDLKDYGGSVLFKPSEYKAEHGDFLHSSDPEFNSQNANGRMELVHRGVESVSKGTAQLEQEKFGKDYHSYFRQKINENISDAEDAEDYKGGKQSEYRDKVIFSPNWPEESASKLRRYDINRGLEKAGGNSEGSARLVATGDKNGSVYSASSLPKRLRGSKTMGFVSSRYRDTAGIGGGDGYNDDNFVSTTPYVYHTGFENKTAKSQHHMDRNSRVGQSRVDFLDLELTHRPISSMKNNSLQERQVYEGETNIKTENLETNLANDKSYEGVEFKTDIQENFPVMRKFSCGVVQVFDAPLLDSDSEYNQEQNSGSDGYQDWSARPSPAVDVDSDVSEHDDSQPHKPTVLTQNKHAGLKVVAKNALKSFKNSADSRSNLQKSNDDQVEKAKVKMRVDTDVGFTNSEVNTEKNTGKSSEQTNTEGIVSSTSIKGMQGAAILKNSPGFGQEFVSPGLETAVSADKGVNPVVLPKTRPKKNRFQMLSKGLNITTRLEEDSNETKNRGADSIMKKLELLVGLEAQLSSSREGSATTGIRQSTSFTSDIDTYERSGTPKRYNGAESGRSDRYRDWQQNAYPQRTGVLESARDRNKLYQYQKGITSAHSWKNFSPNNTGYSAQLYSAEQQYSSPRTGGFMEWKVSSTPMYKQQEIMEDRPSRGQVGKIIPEPNTSSGDKSSKTQMVRTAGGTNSIYMSDNKTSETGYDSGELSSPSTSLKRSPNVRRKRFGMASSEHIPGVSHTENTQADASESPSAQPFSSIVFARIGMNSTDMHPIDIERFKDEVSKGVAVDETLFIEEVISQLTGGYYDVSRINKEEYMVCLLDEVGRVEMVNLNNEEILAVLRKSGQKNSARFAICHQSEKVHSRYKSQKYSSFSPGAGIDASVNDINADGRARGVGNGVFQTDRDTKKGHSRSPFPVPSTYTSLQQQQPSFLQQGGMMDTSESDEESAHVSSKYNPQQQHSASSSPLYSLARNCNALVDKSAESSDDIKVKERVRAEQSKPASGFEASSQNIRDDVYFGTDSNFNANNIYNDKIDNSGAVDSGNSDSEYTTETENSSDVHISETYPPLTIKNVELQKYGSKNANKLQIINEDDGENSINNDVGITEQPYSKNDTAPRNKSQTGIRLKALTGLKADALHNATRISVFNRKMMTADPTFKAISRSGYNEGQSFLPNTNAWKMPAYLEDQHDPTSALDRTESDPIVMKNDDMFEYEGGLNSDRSIRNVRRSTDSDAEDYSPENGNGDEDGDEYENRNQNMDDGRYNTRKAPGLLTKSKSEANIGTISRRNQSQMKRNLRMGVSGLPKPMTTEDDSELELNFNAIADKLGISEDAIKTWKNNNLLYPGTRATLMESRPSKNQIVRPSANLIAADLDLFFPGHDFDQPVVETIEFPIPILSDGEDGSAETNENGSLVGKSKYHHIETSEYNSHGQSNEVPQQYSSGTTSAAAGGGVGYYQAYINNQDNLNIEQPTAMPTSSIVGMQQGGDSCDTFDSEHNPVLGIPKEVANPSSHIDPTNTENPALADNAHSNSFSRTTTTSSSYSRNRSANDLEQAAMTVTSESTNDGSNGGSVVDVHNRDLQNKMIKVGVTVTRGRSLRAVVQETQRRRDLLQMGVQNLEQGSESTARYSNIKPSTASRTNEQDQRQELNSSQRSLQNDDLSAVKNGSNQVPSSVGNSGDDGGNGDRSGENGMTLEQGKLGSTDLSSFSSGGSQNVNKYRLSTKLWGLVPQEVPPVRSSKDLKISDISYSRLKDLASKDEQLFKKRSSRQPQQYPGQSGVPPASAKYTNNGKIDLSIASPSSGLNEPTMDHQLIIRRALSLIKKPNPQTKDELALVDEAVKAMKSSSSHMKKRPMHLRSLTTAQHASLLARRFVNSQNQEQGEINTDRKPLHNNINTSTIDPNSNDPNVFLEKFGLSEAQTKIQWIKGRLIGKGSFGQVYLALNVLTCEVIAVKQIAMPSLGSSSRKLKKKESTMLRQLYMEIELLKDLDHPNIVQYLGFEMNASTMNIFLEYVAGGTISSLILQHGPLYEEVIFSFLNQILNGLAYLHARKILHRDIKSANILVEESGICKISDFGISKRNDYSLAYDTNSRMSVKGSIFWMAPEVIKGSRYSAKVDIWSLGCVLVEMWSGRRPWYGFDTVQAMFKLGAGIGPPLPSDLPPEGIDFCKRCLMSDPTDRPTAKELLQSTFAQPPENYDYSNFYGNY